MLAAANFTETNGLHFNGVFQESLNLDEWLEQISNDYLLRLVELNGKFGFRPRLPVNVDHTIKITTIDWDYTFTEDHLLPDGFEIQYIPLADRQPVTLQMMWRQQPDADIGFPRTTQIGYTGEAAAGPFEQYDLSGYCTNETHAVKVGAYRLARRKFITHTLRLTVRPGNYNSILSQGDIVRVRLRRETALAALDYHDFLYEIERIEKTASGACIFDLTHFPIDSQGRSLVALEVAAATAPGITIASGRSDYSCDENSATQGTVVSTSGIDYPAFDDTPAEDETEVDLPSPGAPDAAVPETPWETGGDSPIGPDVSPPAIGPDVPSGGIPPSGGFSNPTDPLEEEIPVPEDAITGGTGTAGAPVDGDTLEVDPAKKQCDNGITVWILVGPSGAESVLGTGDNIEVPRVCDGSKIKVERRCVDPSTPDGYGPPIDLGETDPIECNQEFTSDQPRSIVFKWERRLVDVRIRCSDLVVETDINETFVGNEISGTAWGIRITPGDDGSEASPCGDSTFFARKGTYQLWTGSVDGDGNKIWGTSQSLWGSNFTSSTAQDVRSTWFTVFNTLTFDGVNQL